MHDLNGYFDGDDYYHMDGTIIRHAKRKPLQPGHTSISEVKPPCGHYSYSNPNSQGSLICETNDFPAGYDESVDKFWSAYSDRIRGWDCDRFNDACELAGTGEQGWASALPRLSEVALKEFAKVALNLPVTPTHVRIVHYFNVSNGYSCPTVEAIYRKPS